MINIWRPEQAELTVGRTRIVFRRGSPVVVQKKKHFYPRAWHFVNYPDWGQTAKWVFTEGPIREIIVDQEFVSLVVWR